MKVHQKGKTAEKTHQSYSVWTNTANHSGFTPTSHPSDVPSSRFGTSAQAIDTPHPSSFCTSPFTKTTGGDANEASASAN